MRGTFALKAVSEIIVYLGQPVVKSVRSKSLLPCYAARD